MKSSQSDIAAKLGVSVSTVSRALSNDAGISLRVRDEVRRVAGELGYRNKRAANATGRSATVLVPLSGATSGMASFYDGIIEGMMSAAAELGLPIEVRLTNAGPISVPLVREHLEATGGSALLLAGIDLTDELCDWCHDAGITGVLVNGTDPKMRWSSAAPANFFGARLATSTLLEAGHRNIVHYTHRSRPTVLARRYGFEVAMAAAGATATILRSDEVGLEAFLDDLTEGSRRATAVFAWNDVAAVEILQGLRNLSYSIPADFSIVGFDDLPIASIAVPRLTTIQVDRRAIGAAAVRLAHAHLSGERSVQQVEVGVQLVRGGTVGQPRTV
jgi:DNA-binding LacI/PurR family transcriptional regulator